MTSKDYKNKFNKLGIGVKVDYDWFMDTYNNEVKPYIPVITTFIKEDNLTHKEIAFVLGVNYHTFKMMIEMFDELSDALKSAKSLMKYKAQFDLQKGLKMKPASGKLLEMQLLRYDDGFKKKADVEVELPKTITFEVKNAKKTDEELEKYAPDIDD